MKIYFVPSVWCYVSLIIHVPHSLAFLFTLRKESLLVSLEEKQLLLALLENLKHFQTLDLPVPHFLFFTES